MIYKRITDFTNYNDLSGYDNLLLDHEHATFKTELSSVKDYIIREINIDPTVIKFSTATVISDGSITNEKLALTSVSTGNIRDNAITEVKIADSSISTSKLSSASVTSDKLANNSVTVNKINDGAINSSKLGENSVIGSKLADSSVSTSKIINNNVTTEKLADACITNTKLGLSSIATNNIQDGSITLEKLAAGITNNTTNNTINTIDIGNRSITTDKIALTSITTELIAATAVTTDKIALTSITTELIAATAVTTAKIALSSVTTALLANSAVTTAKIALSSVTTALLASSAVTTDKLNNSAVTTEKLNDSAVTNLKLAENSVKSGNLDIGAVTNSKIEDATIKIGKVHSEFVKPEGGLEITTTGLQIKSTNVSAGDTLNFLNSKWVSGKMKLSSLDNVNYNEGASISYSKTLSTWRASDPQIETVTEQGYIKQLAKCVSTQNNAAAITTDNKVIAWGLLGIEKFGTVNALYSTPITNYMRVPFWVKYDGYKNPALYIPYGGDYLDENPTEEIKELYWSRFAGMALVGPTGKEDYGSVWTIGTNTGIASAVYADPSGVALTNEGDLLICDTTNNQILKIIPEIENRRFNQTNIVLPKFIINSSLQVLPPSNPFAIPLVGNGPDNTYFATVTNQIWKYNEYGQGSPLNSSNAAGIVDGLSSVGRFNQPYGIAYHADVIYVADYLNHRIRKIDTEANNRSITTIAGASATITTSPVGSKDGSGTNSRFLSPVGMVYDSVRNILYVSEASTAVTGTTAQCAHRIRKLVFNNATSLWDVTTIAGTFSAGYADSSVGTNARFKNPEGLALDSNGDIFVADYLNHRIRKIDRTTFAVTTFFGNGTAISKDGTGILGSTNGPYGIVINKYNDDMYICERGGDKLRKITKAGVGTTYNKLPTSTLGLGCATDKSTAGFIKCNIYDKDILGNTNEVKFKSIKMMSDNDNITGNMFAALDSTDSLWVWGSSPDGCLGIGTVVASCSSSPPVKVHQFKNNVKEYEFCSGDTSSTILSIITKDNRLYSAGDNTIGQLGRGYTGVGTQNDTTIFRPCKKWTTSSYTVSQDVDDAYKLAKTPWGGFHNNIYINTSGKLYSMGFATYGVLGNMDYNLVGKNTTYRLITGGNIGSEVFNKVLITGYDGNTVFASTDSGKLYSWGMNGTTKGLTLTNITSSVYVYTPTRCWDYDTKTFVSSVCSIYTSDSWSSNVDNFHAVSYIDSDEYAHIGGYNTDNNSPDDTLNLPYFRKMPLKHIKNIILGCNTTDITTGPQHYYTIFHKTNGTLYGIGTNNNYILTPSTGFDIKSATKMI